jgi:hypothetical protein
MRIKDASFQAHRLGEFLCAVSKAVKDMLSPSNLHVPID